ncbi:MAG: DNA-formamidopyrimidine glycosylase family protein [Pseudomonadota bacterium]
MPEFPDVEVYIEALEGRVLGKALTRLEITNPFVLRTVDPPVSAFAGKVVQRLSRIGKRIVFSVEDDLHIVVHLMIAGRFQWSAGAPKRKGLARWHFEHGSVVLTEAGTKRRASLHLVRGEEALEGLDPGGAEVHSLSFDDFRHLVATHNHTLKRFLTDPRLLSGIGNAYSDEILHDARLSPVRLTSHLDDAECRALYDATRSVLVAWRDRLRAHYGERFPSRVTAFREGMAVHGRYGEPCPRCETAVQRIRYAEHETNYCPRCQTDGKLLADRALSRLLKEDWPRTIDELERQQTR